MDWKFWIYVWITSLIRNWCAGTVVWEDRVRFLREPNEKLQVNAGADVEIPCLAVDGTSSSGRRLSVRWMRNGTVADDLTPRANGSLILRNVQIEQEAIYQCAVLSTRYGVVLSQRANLTVSKITGFAAEPQDVAALIGGTARFPCIVAPNSIPSVTITWFHDQLPLSNDVQRFRILPSGILQIVDVSESDEGSYHCIASNVAGNITSRTATLTTSKDNLSLSSEQDVQLRVLKAPDNVSVTAGQAAIFECLFDGSVSVIWKKIGDSPLSSTAYQIGTNLVVNHVSQWDEGIYACVGSDTAGKSSTLLAHLSVDAPPEIRKLPEEKLSRRGEWWRFHCDTASKPAPDIVWYKDGERLRSHGRIKIFPHEDQLAARLEKPSGEVNYGRDLLISSVQAEDVGIYQCFASNYLGTASAAAALSYLDVDLDGPNNLTASVLPNQRELMLTWQPPELKDEKYQLTVYIVHFHESEAGSENTVAVQQDACHDGICRTVCCSNVDLVPYTNYTFWVDALVVYQGEPLFTRTTELTVLTSGDAASLTVAPALMQEMRDASRVRLSWQSPPIPDLRGHLLEYKIEVKESFTEDGTDEYRPALVLPPTSESCIIDGLVSGSIVHVRVIPRTRAGFPETLPEKTYPWLRYKPRAVNGSSDALAAPVLEAHALNSTSVIVNWTPVVGVPNASSWLVAAYRPSDGLRLLRSEVDKDMNSVVLLGLASDTLYQLSVAAVNAEGVEGMTAIRLVRTSAMATAPLVSVPLTSKRVIPFPTPSCRVVGSGKLKVFWNTPPVDIVKFALRYSLLPDDNEPLNVSAYVKQIETSSSFVIFTDLVPGRNYLFATRAENADGYKSSFSDDIVCFVPVIKPSPPADVQLSVINGTALFVTWSPSTTSDSSSGDILFYHVRYSTNLADPVGWRELIVNGSTNTAYLPGLNSSAVYFVSVSAESEAGRSDESHTQAAHIGPFSNNNGSTNPSLTVIFQTSYKEGIIIGASIAVVCAIVCAVVIIIRSRRDRCFCIHGFGSRRRTTSKSPNGHVPNSHCKAERRIELAEIQTLLPRLIENSESDSKGGVGFFGPRGCPVTRANFSLLPVSSNGVANDGCVIIQESSQPPSELLTVSVRSPCTESEQERDHSSDLSQSPVTASSMGSWRYSNNGDAVNGYLLQRNCHSSFSMPNLFDSGIGFDEFSSAQALCNGRYYLLPGSRNSPRRDYTNLMNGEAPVDSITLPACGFLANGNAAPVGTFQHPKTKNGKLIRLRDLLVSNRTANPANDRAAVTNSDAVRSASSNDRATSQCTY